MLNNEAKEWLSRMLGHNVKFDEVLARYTSFKIGGPADALVEPEHEEQLKAIIEWSQKKKIPLHVLGGGTNLLIRDGGIRGIVIRLGRFAGRLDWELKPPQVLVQVGAGVPTKRLCKLALQQGWQGMNFALGIPGTVGGAILMNAGTQHGCMADVIEAVTVMTSGGRKIQLRRDSLTARYRQLDLPKALMENGTGTVILIAGLIKLQKGDHQAIRSEARAIMQRRVRHQPAWQPSAGCFFKNPGTGKTAGQLIDEAGMKGVRVGDAVVSRHHANFIVNMGHASADQVLELATKIQGQVEKNTGVCLAPEVHIIGEEKSRTQK